MSDHENTSTGTAEAEAPGTGPLSSSDSFVSVTSSLASMSLQPPPACPAPPAVVPPPSTKDDDNARSAAVQKFLLSQNHEEFGGDIDKFLHSQRLETFLSQGWPNWIKVEGPKITLKPNGIGVCNNNNSSTKVGISATSFKPAPAEPSTSKSAAAAAVAGGFKRKQPEPDEVPRFAFQMTSYLPPPDGNSKPANYWIAYQFAMAGLFLNGDKVQCFICHRNKTNQELQRTYKDLSDPWKVHKDMKPECPLLDMDKPFVPDGYTVEQVLFLLGESKALKLEIEFEEMEKLTLATLNSFRLNNNNNYNMH